MTDAIKGINTVNGDKDITSEYNILKNMFLTAFRDADKASRGDLFDLCYNVYGLAMLKSEIQQRFSSFIWVYKDLGWTDDQTILLDLLEKGLKASCLQRNGAEISKVEALIGDRALGIAEPERKLV
jgi:hypothetical protein